MTKLNLRFFGALLIGLGTLATQGHGQQAQNMAFSNNAGLVFRDAAGTNDGTILKRFTGNALRLQYRKNVFAFDALDNNSVIINDSNGNMRFNFNPSGPSFLNGGKVGITTDATPATLNVGGAIAVITPDSAPRGAIASDEAIRISGPTSDYTISVQDGTGRVQHYWNAGVGPNAKYLVANEAAGKIAFSPASPNVFEIYQGAGGAAGAEIAWKNLFSIGANGNVGIGIPATGAKLAVNGGVKAKSVEVTMAGFPDFVFAEDYDLPTLESVEAFIGEHKHLPGVPAEQEVVENGMDLGQMDAILMQKVEELTLYMIQLNKENKALRADNALLKQAVEELKNK